MRAPSAWTLRTEVRPPRARPWSNSTTVEPGGRTRTRCDTAVAPVMPPPITATAAGRGASGMPPSHRPTLHLSVCYARYPAPRDSARCSVRGAVRGGGTAGRQRRPTGPLQLAARPRELADQQTQSADVQRDLSSGAPRPLGGEPPDVLPRPDAGLKLLRLAGLTRAAAGGGRRRARNISRPPTTKMALYMQPRTLRC